MKTRLLGILTAQALLVGGLVYWGVQRSQAPEQTPEHTPAEASHSLSHTGESLSSSQKKGAELASIEPSGAAQSVAQSAQDQRATQWASTHKALQEMNVGEINRFLDSLKGLDLQRRIERVSGQALNTPYVLGPLGEGAKAPFDSDPLIDLKRVDCVTYCEQTLALALSSDYNEAFDTLQKIRYKQGEVKMECRNHYTMVDWVPNNRWLLDDITPELTGHQWLERTISHRNLFASQKFEGIEVREADRKAKQAYIPEARIQQVLPQLKSGDIGVLIMNNPGIFAAHTGFMIQKPNGAWVYRNATSIGPKKVVDTALADLLQNLQKSKRLIGMAFVRPKAEALQVARL